jgi:phenylacetate-CoA ligase
LKRRAVSTKQRAAQVGQKSRSTDEFLQHVIKVFVGERLCIPLKLEGAFERNQGKARRMVNLHQR